jgi:hypothetical protein
MRTRKRLHCEIPCIKTNRILNESYIQARGTASGGVMKNILQRTNKLVTLAILANVMHHLFPQLIILNKQ